MRRTFTDPADQRFANRMVMTNIAVYSVLTLAAVLFAHLTSTSTDDQVVRAPATGMALQRTVAQ